MNGTSTVRRPYVRPMGGWWRRDPFFMRYMIREATALAVLAYAVVLTLGVVRLAQDEAAWNGWPPVATCTVRRRSTALSPALLPKPPGECIGQDRTRGN